MPQHKRGPWSQQEDQLLLQLVQVHGASNWVRISTQIQTRSPKQCRERFHQNLKPNLNHDPITPEEGVMIEQMVAEMGKRWAEIARRLRGRSDNAVKNWWNGGMNRRRRSHHQRRAELEVRQQVHQQQQQHQQQQHQQHQHQQHHLHQQQQHQQQHQHMHGLHAPIPQQPLPPAFQQMMPQHFFAQPMFHAPHPHQHMGMPATMPAFGRASLVDAPLPSPSAFSQLSAEGAPSLVSDCSSLSTRSPNNGTSPIELPPLSGARDERQQRIGAQMLRLGVPGAYVQETEYAMPHPHMHMQRYEDLQKQPQMMQEVYMPQMQALPQPASFLPSQPRQPSPMPHHFEMPAQQTRHHAVPMQVPSTPTSMQLPSISKLAHDGKTMDAALATPLTTATTLDDSPKDKMKLSNLTH